MEEGTKYCIDRTYDASLRFRLLSEKADIPGDKCVRCDEKVEDLPGSTRCRNRITF